MIRPLLSMSLTASIASMAIAIPTAARAAAPASIASAVADAGRPADQVATDINRKPAETLALAGVKPGMIVGEFYPGGGYFTQLLSDVVGPSGHVYGLENAGWQSAVKADQDLATNHRLANVTIKSAPFGTVSFPEPLDLAWITQNYHDLKIAQYGEVDTVAFDKAVFAALKPGGIFFIVDHQAAAGIDRATIARLHRIDEAQVVREVTSAGFRLAAKGSFLHRPADDHSLPIFDKRIRGHTDQFALKFVKPAA